LTLTIILDIFVLLS